MTQANVACERDNPRSEAQVVGCRRVQQRVDERQHLSVLAQALKVRNLLALKAELLEHGQHTVAAMTRFVALVERLDSAEHCLPGRVSAGSLRGVAGVEVGTDAGAAGAVAVGAVVAVGCSVAAGAAGAVAVGAVVAVGCSVAAGASGFFRLPPQVLLSDLRVRVFFSWEG